VHQTSLSLWNEIAARQPVSPEWRVFFECATSEELVRLWEKFWVRQRQPFGTRIRRAFEVVAPLFYENETISAYIEDNERVGLRAALPEVLTIDEAVALAALEYRLDAGEQAELHRAFAAADLQAGLDELGRLFPK